MTEEQVNGLIATYVEEHLDELLAEYLESKEYMTKDMTSGFVDQELERAVMPDQTQINEYIYEYNKSDDGITQIQNICGDYITENFDL